MYWDEEEGGWIVREHKPYSRVATVLSATTNEEEAISKLIEGHEEEF
jgi:DNA-binding MarR family transcriptional regulator